jgi:formylglycine-generating enzyme
MATILTLRRAGGELAWSLQSPRADLRPEMLARQAETTWTCRARVGVTAGEQPQWLDVTEIWRMADFRRERSRHNRVSAHAAVRRARWFVAAALLALAGWSGGAVAEDVPKLCTSYSGLPDGEGKHAGMVEMYGGSFTMGSEEERPEEKSARWVTVSPFWIDRTEVTNAQFALFVKATGYRTVAERGLDPNRYPNMPRDLLQPGSMVFSPPDNPVELDDVTRWWRFQEGAYWREPNGPGSSIEGLENHPVVHVAYEDALAYAKWLGHDLPTEAEWEFAARGGLEGARYTWGDSYDPVEGWKANSWQGNFPSKNTADDGYVMTAPVGCYPPNNFGLYDMAGNVWEYVRDYWVPSHPPRPATNPKGPGLMFAMRFGGPMGPSVVLKGGSFLCTPQYCLRYRPAARQPQEQSLGASHIGFRTVLRE